MFLITNSIVKFCDYFFSTHPMLLFNRFITSLRQGFIISIHSVLLFNRQLLWRYYNFNTSHVVIQRSFQTVVCFKINNFDTSHVVIQLLSGVLLDCRCSFQYILCYYSTTSGGIMHSLPIQDFNTSYVVIQRNGNL